jgi:hypothetical protein
MEKVLSLNDDGFITEAGAELLGRLEDTYKEGVRIAEQQAR